MSRVNIALQTFTNYQTWGACEQQEQLKHKQIFYDHACPSEFYRTGVYLHSAFFKKHTGTTEYPLCWPAVSEMELRNSGALGTGVLVSESCDDSDLRLETVPPAAASDCDTLDWVRLDQLI